MPFAKLNDIEVFYEVHGSGYPIVLVSGFSADHSSWDAIRDQLALRYRVITFDNRGVGQTTVTKSPYLVEDFANDTAALCRHLKIDSAYFIGNSMGGMIVQCLLKNEPSLVKKAVISNSSANLNVGWKWYVQAQYELAQSGASPEALVKASVAWCFSDAFLSKGSTFNDCVALWSSSPYPFTLEGFAGQMAALNSFDSRKWLSDIKSPCLIISGDEDVLLPSRCSKELAELINDSKYYEFEQVGHLPYVEAADAFVELVCDFL